MNDDLQGFIENNTNSKELVNSFLKKHKIFSIPNRDEQMMVISKVVGEIPWGMGRTVNEVLVSKGVGTCTGKHRVLQQCFDILNIPYQPVVCTFKWGEQGIEYPKNLQKILNEGEEWDHGHNFVRAKNLGGRWIDIDVNWDSHMKQFGFIIANDWDGKSNLVAVKNIIERWDGVDIGEMKVQLIKSLSSKQRERRKKFLNGFIDWISSTRV